MNYLLIHIILKVEYLPSNDWHPLNANNLRIQLCRKAIWIVWEWTACFTDNPTAAPRKLEWESHAVLLITYGRTPPHGAPPWQSPFSALLRNEGGTVTQSVLLSAHYDSVKSWHLANVSPFPWRWSGKVRLSFNQRHLSCQGRRLLFLTCVPLIWLLFFLRCQKPCQGPGRGCCHLIQTPREDTDVVVDNLLLQYFSAELRRILSLLHYQKYMKFSPLIKRCHVSWANT